MSQAKVLLLLTELGGRATRKQIADLALLKYPDASLHAYVGLRLRELKKWEKVDYNATTREWFILPEV